MNQQKEIIKEVIPSEAERAVFAAGCFWCLEANLQAVPGVLGAINGYAGGTEFNPSYREVCRGQTSHRETVLVYYDSTVISYQELLDLFWQNIDPTDAGGQFFDRGLAYTTAVFYLSEQQKKLAQASFKKIQNEGRFDQPIATQILPYTTFYQAEDYHQDFYKHYPKRYKSYTQASGREEFKKLVWRAIVDGQS